MTSQKLNIDRTPQLNFFSDSSDASTDKQTTLCNSKSGRVFISPDPEGIWLGHSSLRQHLQQAQQKTPFTVASILDSHWSVFEARYASSGRPPYAPRNMTGLILCGIMSGITSLRGLEELARLNLGCMWVSGGIFPDHANIGRFINMHAQSLTGDFFDSLTVTVLEKTGSTGNHRSRLLQLQPDQGRSGKSSS
ncbi:MAG: transposase [Endozoicomonas sp.]